jgi:vancomycin resistance protein VanJ
VLLLSAVASVLCVVYAVSVLGFLLLYALIPRVSPLITLLSAFVPFFFAPLLLVLPLAWMIRSRVGLVSVSVLFVTFLALYGSRFLPRFGKGAGRNGEAFTVMTYNLGGAHRRAEQVAATIGDEGADIVALQELLPSTAALLRRRLGDILPYAVLDPGTSNGLFSRYPIVESSWFKPAGNGRSAIDATLDVQGTPLRVIVVHARPPDIVWPRGKPLWSAGLRDDRVEAELRDVVSRIAGAEGPLLVVGDLNTTERSLAYQALTNVLRDAYREVGWGFGFTFPYRLRVGDHRLPGPFLRLDHIFYSHDLDASWARVACRLGSDHCYLAAGFAHR